MPWLVFRLLLITLALRTLRLRSAGTSNGGTDGNGCSGANEKNELFGSELGSGLLRRRICQTCRGDTAHKTLLLHVPNPIAPIYRPATTQLSPHCTITSIYSRHRFVIPDTRCVQSPRQPPHAHQRPAPFVTSIAYCTQSFTIATRTLPQVSSFCTFSPSRPKPPSTVRPQAPVATRSLAVKIG